MKKIYYLDTCNTCKRIISEVSGAANFRLQNLKEQNVTEGDLGFFKEKAGSYEALFNRRAIKYRSMGLHEKELTEDDYKNLILKEYTFLKRPVIVIDTDVFVGNSKKTVAAAKEKLGLT